MSKLLSFMLITVLGLLNACTSSKENKSYFILKQFDKITAQRITTFAYLKDGLKTDYTLELSRENKTVLKNTATGKIEEEYKSFPTAIANYPGNNCAKQEDQQWENFRVNILPGLINRANSTCTVVKYCVGIYCNGQPRVFYLLLIPPTASNCIKFTNITTESNRYAF